MITMQPDSSQTPTSASSEQQREQFAAAGRSGRRNALAYIHSVHAHTSTSQLPDQMAALSCSADSPGVQQQCTDKCDANEASVGACGGGSDGGDVNQVSSADRHSAGTSGQNT